MQDIAIKNLSSVVSDSELAAALPAFQTQMDRDFAPIWGIGARLRIVAKEARLADGEWLIGLFDDADSAGILGYHETTTKGAPLGKVFVKTTKDYGGLWTVTFSHELLEQLMDPWINMCFVDETNSRIYAAEMCDPCEDDSLGYVIDGVTVSDFILPSWAEPDLKTDVPRSFCGHLKTAFSLAPGGYVSYLDFSSGQGWQQKQESRADGAPEGKPHGLSRHPRRARGAADRRRSTAE